MVCEVLIIVSTAVAFYSVIAGSLLFMLSIGMIYFRGYLIPATPKIMATLKKSIRLISDNQNYDGIDAMEYITKSKLTNVKNVGVSINKNIYNYDVNVTRETYNQWLELIQQSRKSSARDLINEIAQEEDDITIEHFDSVIVAASPGSFETTWPSEEAIHLDYATFNLFGKDEKWENLHFKDKLIISKIFRTFLVNCICCSNSIMTGTEQISDQYRDTEAINLICEECGVIYGKYYID